MFHANFLCFAPKIVEHSRYLLPARATCLQQQVRQEREPSRMGLDLRDLKSGFFDEVGSVPIPMTIAEQARRHRNQCW
jgi:hypothetical protein